MAQESSMRRVLRTSITVVSNPREYFDPVEMDELVDSMRKDGQMQNLVVCLLPPDGTGVPKYKLIAGERRLRAAAIIGMEYMDVKVVEADDAVAGQLAVKENTIRADMSPTEEANAAFKEMALQNNDKAEVLRVLCWSPTKLEQRLALMRCAPEVRTALNERKILLGHAELLAAVPVEKQVSSLGKIIENKLTVAYVKQNLAKVAQSLPKAFFDQTECLTCNYNTACQTGLFAETIDEGFCTNSPCYERKTAEALGTLKDELVNDYPVVRIIALGDANTSIPLQATGTLGVGAEQAKACRACENFGCTISGLPESTGSVERDLCFDAACNASKVASFIRASRPKAEPTQKDSTEKGSSTKPPAKGTVKSGTKGPEKKKAVVQIPAKVKEYRVALWRKMARKELLARSDDALTMLVALSIIGSSRHISSGKMGEAYVKLTGASAIGTSYDLAGVLNTVRGNGVAKTRLLEAISASAMGNIEERQLVAALQFLRVDVRNHWKPCADFFNLMTKSEIEVVAEELGIKGALGAGFAKIAGGKKDALVKALLSVEGFDYDDAVPDVLVYGPVDADCEAEALVPGADSVAERDDADLSNDEASEQLALAETN